MSFVTVEVKTSAAELVTEALERWASLMQAVYPGWEPQPADIVTIAIEALGPLASDVAEVLAVLPEAAFRAFGTKLVGIAYKEGAQATGTTLWTLSDTKGHTITQGTQVSVGNLGFLVEKDVEVEAGKETATVQIVAAEQGGEYNKLTGTVELEEAIDWVSEVTLEGETTGGAEPETDAEYQERLADELKLQAPRPITASDYASFVLSVPSTVLPSGVTIGRATAIDGYNAETKEEEIERCVTTFVTDPEGKALSKAHMEAVQKWLREYRELNFLAFIEAPTYTAIYATAKVKVREGYDSEAVATEAKEAIESFLSPETWGTPAATIGGSAWSNETKVRYNAVIGAIEGVQGVAYVLEGSEGLAIGTEAEPKETKDISLTGPAPLPETKSTYVLVTT